MNATVETLGEAPAPTTADRIADAARHAAHLSHEARLMRSMARDAGEDAVHAARRAMKQVARGAERVEDLRDDAIHYVKHRPMAALGIAAGIGLAAGVVVGWMGGLRASMGCHSHHRDAA